MDNQKRFDQLESQLVDIARRQDQQAEQVTHILKVLHEHGEAINSLGEILNSQTDVLNSHTVSLERQEVRLDNIGEQIGDIINILKLSEARHTETERRQDAMMAEIRQQGQRIDAQGQRQDVAVDALKVLLKRQQATDSRLDDLVQTELQMLQLMRRDAEQLDDHAPRLKRLEDQVFPAAD